MPEEKPRPIDPEKRSDPYLDLTPEQIAIEIAVRGELGKARADATASRDAACAAAQRAFVAACRIADRVCADACAVAVSRYNATSPKIAREDEVELQGE